MKIRKPQFHTERVIRICNRFAVFLQLFASGAVYFLMEWMSRHSAEEAWKYMVEKPLVFLFNVLIIFSTTTIVFLFRCRVFVRVLIYVFWILMGAFNGIILSNRVTPFTGPDLKLAADAFKIAKNYITPFTIIAALVVVLVVFLTLFILFRRGPVWQGKRHLVRNLILIAASGMLVFAVEHAELNTRLISNYFGNIAFAYKDYGYPYCFLVTLFDTGISQPKGYSEEMISGIMDDVDKALAGKKEEAKTDTNIIFLQLESFMDPETVEFLKLSEDPIPYFHQLMEEYSSGYFRVPVVGAGTVNTEFECITGMSLHYFGAGEYPYKSILKEQPCESIPYLLKDLGYATHVVHNNEANFYSRRDVFANLGFDTFTSEEYMPHVQKHTETGWIKDEVLTEEIIKCLDKTDEPDYIYTISVQGHGDYPTDPAVSDPPVTVTGAEGRAQNNYSWEYYCKQIREMDEFIRQLTETLAEYPEPVVLVMYGDHLPTMGLETRDLTNRYLFQTQYVIWDNFGLERKEDNLASYQIGAELLDRLGIRTGNVVRYHQARRNSRNYQSDLEALQYDMLYGKKYVYGGESPFQTKEVMMGLDPVVLDRVTSLPDGSWMFYGEHFTAASRVEINGKMQDDTVYLGETQLYLPACEIKPDDMVDIAQQSNSSQTAAKILTKTDEKPFRSYYGGEDS